MKAALEQLDQSRTLNGEEPVVPLPAEKFATNSCVNLQIDLLVDVWPCTLSTQSTITSLQLVRVKIYTVMFYE